MINFYVGQRFGDLAFKAIITKIEGEFVHYEYNLTPSDGKTYTSMLGAKTLFSWVAGGGSRRWIDPFAETIVVDTID